MILGGSGSGKSTLARALGARTGLPVYHMDHIHWLPGWQPRPRALRRDLAHDIENRDAWIFEGGFSTTYAHRLSRADTVIWLDLPLGLRLWRVTKRLIRYWGQSRPDMAEGCVEGIHAETWPFYQWIWSTRHTARMRVADLLGGAEGSVAIHHLTSRAAVRRFMKEVPC